LLIYALWQRRRAENGTARAAFRAPLLSSWQLLVVGLRRQDACCMDDAQPERSMGAKRI
jgi:hypothetical protein